MLTQLLDAAFGDETTSRVLIHAALRSARRTTLPGEPEALLDFVRAHLTGSLTEELGPRVAAALLDQLATDVRRGDDVERTSTRRRTPLGSPSVSEVPQSSGVRRRASVLLVDHDRFARASLARTLVSGSCDVVAVESPLDVRTQEGQLDVAIVNMGLPDVAAVLGALLAHAQNVRIIALAVDAAAAETLLRAAGVRTYRVVPRAMKPAELLTLIKRLSAA